MISCNIRHFVNNSASSTNEQQTTPKVQNINFNFCHCSLSITVSAASHYVQITALLLCVITDGDYRELAVGDRCTDVRVYSSLLQCCTGVQSHHGVLRPKYRYTGSYDKIHLLDLVSL